VAKINNVSSAALAIAFIALAVMLVGGGVGVTTTSHTTTVQKAFAQSQRPHGFQGSDRCVSFQFSNGGTAITCVTSSDRKLTNEIINGFKNDCKEAQEEGLVDKCSGSQSGFGVFCNWVRVKGDVVVAVFRSADLSCSEVRHIQKDILGQ
jgi:hypothetical protein